MPSTEVVTLHGLAHGGDAVGRLADGRAVFVPYAIPGETVLLEVVQERRRWSRARLLDVVEPSADRVEAPCPYFGPGRCGGCRWQHVAYERQLAMVRRIVIEQLERLGGVREPPVTEAVPAGDYGYRSRARFAVTDDGRLGFRRAGSHDLQPVDRCLLLDEPTQRLRAEAGDSFGGADEVEVRFGHAGGALVIHPGAGGLAPLPPGDVPVALTSASGRASALRGDPTLTEQVAGFRFRVSATSFFQANRTGAEALVRLVRDAAAVRPGDRALDCFAGVGLFARALAADGADVTAVESQPSSAADAGDNLAGFADVVQEPVAAVVARLPDDSADVVVLDPPRKGAGTTVARDLARVARRVIVYVACDPAALARDARALSDGGWRLRRAVPVHQFAQTAQVEVVAAFRPQA